ncbi:hypothetical protein AMECASPLE_025943 [Ameca splendens]|uniref:Uncharacterized protein n=1 Tax=Ameca splendens TaxID=208324 RepID=A0ABV0ZFP1_9TELE
MDVRTIKTALDALFFTLSFNPVCVVILHKNPWSNSLCTRQEVCVDAVYLCAQKSTTIMIGMLEDEVALETEKHKMPHIHSQIKKQLFILCAQALSFFFCFAIFFHPPSRAPSALSYLSLFFCLPLYGPS